MENSDDSVVAIYEWVCCNAIRYYQYHTYLDNLLNSIVQQADQQQGPGFGTYNNQGSYHAHACCPPTLREEDCSRCIHGALEAVRHHCGHRIGGLVTKKLQGSNYACELRCENYDMDNDSFSCSCY
ncbi:hypothetical protein MLD38_027229 [Melastoma candidum]|uniref:Uncharacterized protein n=1 Tax=Melastoma candidum TaxID=119954 RepID=A0ACB9P118_9MYRT|nr:hypothetical protein MLD38_027229 [Melastoma candidum]